MRLHRRVVALLLVVGFITTLAVSPAQAASGCHEINAKGVGQDAGGGVTHAQVIGGGLLHGTTDGNFAITAVNGTVASISGTVTFTTNQATLTVSVDGTFDTSNGAFDASGPVSGATGKLAGATGNLSLVGVENLSNGRFVEDIDGRICLS